MPRYTVGRYTTYFGKPSGDKPFASAIRARGYADAAYTVAEAAGHHLSANVSLRRRVWQDKSDPNLYWYAYRK